MNTWTRGLSIISALTAWAAAARLLDVWLTTGILATALIAIGSAAIVAIACVIKASKIRDNPPHVVYLASLHLLIVQTAAHVLPLIFLPIKEPAFYAGIIGAVVLFALAIYRTRMSLKVSSLLDVAMLCIALVNAYFVFIARPGWI